MPRTATTQPPKRRFMSLTKAGEYLGVSRRTMYRWVTEGRIRGYRIGDHIKVEQADLDAFIQPVPTAGDA
jgi:excisionase family DNA binding protein